MKRRFGSRERWGTRIGVIMAVTGSAVGLGNFLRFPGQAAQFGGGAFLIPYLVAFLLVGLPLAWVEWALGRYGGACGHNSAPGIFRALTGRRSSAYMGMMGTLMPVMIYTYYVFIEAWCLYYAWTFANRTFVRMGADSDAITAFFMKAVGATEHGALFKSGINPVLVCLALCFLFNFYLIYRGLRRGIEMFCNIAMPLLVLCAIIVLVRVLTLPANPLSPDQNILTGLGAMWNPTKPGQTLLEALANPDIWLAATGQIFFSLSLGFGLILTYSSYLRRDDDIALSSLTSCAGNGFCEVVLGGMIAIPAAFIFLGPAVTENPPGTFGMGFITLPNVFNQMPAGSFFGFLFFFLLFLAAVTSSLSMLQPAIALLEEGLGLNRKRSVLILGALTLAGVIFIVYFSKGFTALDTVDFWMANFFIFIFATLQTVLFGWVLGIDQGMKELKRGAEIGLPRGLKFVIKYVAPSYLTMVFVAWCIKSLPDRIADIIAPPTEGPPVPLLSVLYILLVIAFFTVVVTKANRAWDKETEKMP